MPANRESESKLREQAVDWLLRLQDRPEDTALEAEFKDWLSGDPSRELICRRVQRVMGDASYLLSSDTGFARSAAKRTMPRARNVVASLTFILLCSGAFLLADGPMRLRADVISGVGEPRMISLDDGSEVELNANSAIAISLGTSERRVTLLRGEAYFHVAADPARPFVVAAGNGTTTARGTAFDVNLADSATRVIVTEHAVEVGLYDTPNALRVREREQLSYSHTGGLGQIETVDTDMALAWRQGRLVFDDRPLAAVVEEIARYIPGKIIVAQTDLAERRISGSLNLKTPEETLGSFANAFQINVSRIGPYLTILSK
jgi:transmembrane sensor